jgi:hypothetical protein
MKLCVREIFHSEQNLRHLKFKSSNIQFILFSVYFVVLQQRYILLLLCPSLFRIRPSGLLPLRINLELWIL